MVQQFRMFAALAEDPSFTPSNYIGQLITAFNSSSRSKPPPSGLHRHYMHTVHITHISTHIFIKINPLGGGSETRFIYRTVLYNLTL